MNGKGDVKDGISSGIHADWATACVRQGLNSCSKRPTLYKPFYKLFCELFYKQFFCRVGEILGSGICLAAMPASELLRRYGYI